MKADNKQKSISADGPKDSWQELVRTHVGSLRCGLVQMVVHDSRMVRIERTEKVGLDPKEG
jgi:hypothetical protein